MSSASPVASLLAASIILRFTEGWTSLEEEEESMVSRYDIIKRRTTKMSSASPVASLLAASI
jgi:hypothetical protein